MTCIAVQKESFFGYKSTTTFNSILIFWHSSSQAHICHFLKWKI